SPHRTSSINPCAGKQRIKSRFWQPLLLVAVMVRLERTLRRNADIIGLLLAHLAELGAQLFEMKHRYLLIEMLGQGVDLVLVLGAVGPKLDLRQRLVGEAGAHDEARMAGGVAEVH